MIRRDSGVGPSVCARPTPFTHTGDIMIVLLSEHVMAKIERTFGEYEYLSRQIRLLLGRDGYSDALGLLLSDQERQRRELDVLLDRVAQLLLQN